MKPKTVERLVLRGGSFYYISWGVRCAYRLDFGAPDYGNGDVGFRVVLSKPKKEHEHDFVDLHDTVTR